ncbi:MAG TPA: methyltransferase domain-containing protein, partial [Bdellovibrio sp.]|nr:methyltransferase domain-containing protein [Bdellovibrio sp.]
MSELTDVPISYPDTGNLNYFEVEDDSFWFKFRNEVILSTIKEYIPVTQPRILDVGGGNGYVAKMLQQNSYDVHLCEPGPGAKNAKLRGLRHVYNCMLDQVDGGSSFNILGFFDVVEHIENPKVLLQSAKAHLKH